MSADGEERRIDDKGRVTIPRRIREQLGLESGADVRIELEDGIVVIRPNISRESFVRSTKGCITSETKKLDAPAVTPEDLKSDWTGDLPTHK